MSATVHLVGAGPGNPLLITRRGWDLLRHADVVIYDRLVLQALLSAVPDKCECIFMGKEGFSEHLTQEAINAIIVETAQREGISDVVRLKGGDPCIFGRLGEEAGALKEAGIDYEIVPGVSAASGAGAYSGIPLTQRKITSTVKYLTGNEDPSKPEASIDWRRVANEGGTLCLYMALHRLHEITQDLMAGGLDGKTPVAVVQDATYGRQRVCMAPLSEIREHVKQEGIKGPAIVLIGDVVGRRESLAWFERLPLHGKCIMVTRAKAQADGLAEELLKRGGDVVICPVLKMRALDDHVACDRALNDLGSYTWLVLTSARAVDFMFERLFMLGLDARALSGLRIATIGKATATALKERGLVCDLVPQSYHSRALATALIAEGLGVDDAVLLPRALEASDELPQTLSRAGVRCDVVPLYETSFPEATSWSEDALARLRDGRIDAVTFTSPSSVRNLMTMIDSNDAAKAVKLLSRMDLFSIGPATTGELERFGLEPCVQAVMHTQDGLVRAIEDYYDQDDMM